MVIEFIRRFERPPFARSEPADTEADTVSPSAAQPDIAEPAPIEAAAPPLPAHIAKLFVSSPDYAAAEARQIGAVLARINAAYAGSGVHIAAIGQNGDPLEGAAGPAFAPVECEAVIALMRPRLPDDPPEADGQGGAPARSGIAGILSAMAGRSADAGLPDITIFHYADPAIPTADRAAERADWENRKRVFDSWFKGRGGTFLAFPDFSSPEEFNTGLDGALRGWLDRMGVAEPPAVAPEPALEAPAERPDAALGDSLTELEPVDSGLSGKDSLAAADLPQTVDETALEPSGAAPRDAPAETAPAESEMSATGAEPVPAGTEIPVAAEEADAAGGSSELDVLDIGSFSSDDFGPPPDRAETEMVEALADLGTSVVAGDVADAEASQALEDAAGPIEVGPPIAEIAGDADGLPALDSLVPEVTTAEAEAAETTAEPLAESTPSLELRPNLGEEKEGQPAEIQVPAADDSDTSEAEAHEPPPITATEAEPEISGDDAPAGGEGGQKSRADRRKGRRFRGYPSAQPDVASTAAAEPETAPAAVIETAAAVTAPDAGAAEIPSAETLAVAAGETMPTEQVDRDANAAALAAAFEEARRERERWDERYQALQAETKDAVATALRLEREAKAQQERLRARRQRITWVVFIVLLLALAALATIIGLQWRSAALYRDEARKSLADAADRANTLVSELTRRSAAPSPKTETGSADVTGQARDLLGLLVKAAPHDPAAQQTQAEGYLAAADEAFRQGKFPEAGQAASQAQRVFQALVATKPDEPQWLAQLAQCDARIGEILIAQNKPDEALGSFREALSIRQTLAAKDPADAERQRAVAAIQQKVGDILLTRGQLGDGLKIYGEALAIRKTLAAKDPGNADVQRELMEVSNTNGDLMTAQNRFDDALVLYHDGFAIADRMSKIDPNDPKWTRALTLSDNKIGDIFLAKRRFDDALAAYGEGLATMKLLAQKEPNNSEWQSLVATGDERIGDALAAEGHGDSALSAYQDALAIVKTLAAKDPNAVGWLRGISEVQLRIGSVLFDRDKIDDSIAAHRESLAVVKTLIEKQPDNPRWRRDLMLDDGKIGQLLLTQHKRDEALALYREALAIAREMGGKYPNDPEWLSNRSMIDDNLGQLLIDMGNRDEGLAAFRDGLEIAKTLATREPRNAERQTNLAIAYYNLGYAGEDSNANYAQSLDLLKRLDAAGALPAEKRPMIDQIADEMEHGSKRSAPSARPDKTQKSSALGIASKPF